MPSTELTAEHLRSLVQRPRQEQVRGRTLANVLQDATTVDDVDLLRRIQLMCVSVSEDEKLSAENDMHEDSLTRRLDQMSTASSSLPSSATSSSSIVERGNHVLSYRQAAEYDGRNLRTFSVRHRRIKTSTERFSDILNMKIKDTTLAILAAQNHAVKVMEFLLQQSRQDVDLEKEGTARFEGEERISGATPLWTAAALGGVDIVRLLVKAGAQVNHPSATNSTPLRAACYDGFIEVVRFLAEHGGDVNIRNRFGSGPLHLAAYRGYPNIVKFLLDRGANPNVQTSTDREVPLHHAALMGHADVAKLLVEAGADTAMQSFYDVTPLICASAAGEHSVVDALLQSTTPPVSLKERATAMLLLGAAYVDRHQNRAKAEQIWSQAMTIEGGMTFAHGQLPKYRIYDDIQFPESRAKLKHTLADDWQGFNLASAIREHVLGPSSQDTIHYLRCRGAMEADARRYVKAMKLWLHCLRLEMDSGKKGTTPEVTSTLTACTELLVEQIRNEGDADVKALFEVVWSNLHRHPLGGIECGKTVRILLTVLYVWDKLSSTMPHHFVACREAAQRFVYQRFVLHKGYNNYTPLHLVCDKKTFVSGAKSRKNFCQFPSPPLLKLLLESGADQIIEERDSRGNTPLHTAAASGNVGCVREMLFYLTAKQATLTNHSGVTAASISSNNTPSDKIHMVINEFVSRCK